MTTALCCYGKPSPQSSQNKILWLWVPDRRSLTLACPGRHRSMLRFSPLRLPCQKPAGRNVMSSLSGKQGPRYRHVADESEPYETIAVEKLTPIIGAEISGVDIGTLVDGDALSNRQMDEIHRALAENLVIFFRDQHITPAAASRLRPQVRRAAHSSRRAPRGRRSRADEDLCRQGFPARQRRGLAHRRVLRRRAADGLDPLHQAMPAARRRHAVRQHVCRL